MADFLLEIGLDEVPARMIAGAEAELGRRVNDLLTRERLLASGAKLTTYSTPRRLAVLVEGVQASQADTEEQLTGPSWKVAFKDGAPTKAAEAFAKKAGVPVDALLKDPDKLKKILLYHVVSGKVMAADVVKMKRAKTVVYVVFFMMLICQCILRGI